MSSTGQSVGLSGREKLFLTSDEVFQSAVSFSGLPAEVTVETAEEKPTCCDGPESYKNPLCTAKDVCEVFPGAIAGSVDNDFSNIMSKLVLANKDNIVPISKVKNACRSCYSKAFNTVESEKSFEQERNNLQDIMNMRVAKQQITQSFQALHSYNDSLYRFYGLHADKLDYQIQAAGLSKEEARAKLTCSDSSAIMEKINNPNGVCKSKIDSFKNSADFENYINEQTDWFKNSIGQNSTAGNTFEDMLTDYLDNFNQGNIRTKNSCTTRTMHGNFLAAKFYNKNGQTEGSVSEFVFNTLDNLIPRKDIVEGGSIQKYCNDQNADSLPVSILQSRFVSSLPVSSSQDEDDNALNEAKKKFSTAIYMEPSLNMMLNSKSVFCDSYIEPRKKDDTLNSRAVFENTYKQTASSRELFKMAQEAAKNCEPLYENLANNICNPGPVSGADEEQVKDAANFARSNYFASGIDETEKNLLLNSLLCEKSNLNGSLNTPSLISLNAGVYLSSPYTPDIDGRIFFKGKEYSSRIELMVELRKDKSNLFDALDNYDLFNTAAFNDVEGTCDGINVSQAVQRFHKAMSGDENYAQTKMGYEGKIVGIRSASDISEVDTIDEIVGQAAANMTRTAVADDEKINRARKQTRENISSGKIADMYRARSSTRGGFGNSSSNTVIAGTGLTGRDIAEQAQVQTAESDDTIYSMSEGDGLSSIERLMQETQRATAMYERTKERYSGARDNILNDRSLNPSDVASAISNEPEIQESFDELRDKVAKATGVSESEANNKLVNALAGTGDLSESELGAEKSNAQLLAEIEQLKAEIAEAKRKGDAKSVRDSSDEYIAELENRIKDLEGREARSTRSSRGRSPSSLSANSGSGTAKIGSLSSGSGRNSSFISSMVSPTPTASQAAASILGNLALVRNIIDNPNEFIKSGDFNISLKENQLYLKVAKKDINEPIEISSYSVDSKGQLTAIEFPGRKAISIAALSPESQQALQSYVEKYPELVIQAQDKEIAVTKKEMEEVKAVRATASKVVENPEDPSVYAELVCSLDSDDQLCQN